MGPIATGLGEIFMFTVEAEPGATTAGRNAVHRRDLRTLQDWVIKPQLRNVPGVTEVNTIGGFVKQFHVTPDPSSSSRYGLELPRRPRRRSRTTTPTSAPATSSATASSIWSASPGQVADLEDIAQHRGRHTRAACRSACATSPTVALGEELRTGAATENGREVVLGTVFMLIGENSRTVSQRVAAKLEEINRTLPAGVVAKTVYDRTDARRRDDRDRAARTSSKARCS